MDLSDLAQMLAVRVSTLRAMRSQPERHRRIDGLPEPIRLIGNSPVWDRAEVEAWIAS